MSRILKSWKEIALYLRVSKTTAITYYKTRGLPVLKRPKGRDKRVSTSTSLLDIWYANQIDLQRDKHE